MATLTGVPKSTTYGGLIQIPNSNLGIDTTLRTLQDGKGNSLPVAMSTTLVSFSVSPSAPQNTTSERYGAGANAATFTLSTVIGRNTLSGNLGSTILGDAAYSVANIYNGSSAFGGYPVIIGKEAFGQGVSVGYKASTANYEAVAVGPQARADGLACIAIGDAASAIPSGPNGNETVIGDVAWATGNINLIIGGGSGTARDFIIALGSAGSSTAKDKEVATADHQGFLGWYQHDSSYFSGGVGYINDWWLGGPVTASAPHAISLNITSGLGANIAGVDFTIYGSKGTGSGTPGAIDFQTSTAGASSSTLQTPSSKLKLNGTGIGFFGVAPAARQLIPTGSTTDQVITALQTLGLFRQS